MVSRIVNLFKKRPFDEHAHVRGLSSDYIDGELDDEAEAVMKSHLEWCPPCESFVNTLRATVKLLSSSPATEPPTSFGERLRARIKRERQGQP